MSPCPLVLVRACATHVCSGTRAGGKRGTNRHPVRGSSLNHGGLLRLGRRRGGPRVLARAVGEPPVSGEEEDIRKLHKQIDKELQDTPDLQIASDLPRLDEPYVWDVNQAFSRQGSRPRPAHHCHPSILQFPGVTLCIHNTETRDICGMVFDPAHRYGNVEYFHRDFEGVSYINDRKVAQPITYRTLLPDDYDKDREEPYPLLVVVPEEAGYGGLKTGYTGGLVAVAATDFHNLAGAIVIELGLNFPTWLVDTSSSNHESYLINVLLPHVVQEHNVGRISLLGSGSAGFGALCMLLRHPHIFHRAAVADVPLLGNIQVEHTEWGDIPLNRHKWHTFERSFPRFDMLIPYNVERLVETHKEMTDLHRVFEELEVPHIYDTGYSDECADFSSGWFVEALRMLRDSM